MKLVFATILLCLSGSTSFAQDVSVGVRNYDDIKKFLNYLVDFDELRSTGIPGREYTWPLYYPGLKVGNHFDGQVPTFKQYEFEVSTLLLRVPAKRADLIRNVQQKLKVIRFGDSNSVAGEVNLNVTEVTDVGQGSIAVRFTDPQAALAFDLIKLRNSEIELSILATFFLDDGTVSRLRLSRSGINAVSTSNESRMIWGFTLESTGGSPFGIDNVEYERPMQLGDSLFSSKPTMRARANDLAQTPSTGA